MAEITFTPKCLADKKSQITGTVTIRVPTLPERLRYVEHASLDLSQLIDGETKLSKNEKMELASKNNASLLKLVELSRDHYVKIDLQDKESGHAINTVDELFSDTACDAISIEVASLLVKGFRPTKNSKPL